MERERAMRATGSDQNAWASEAAAPLRVVSRTVERCQVCGFTEIRTDEVVDRGVVFLAECPRCDHRWTSVQPIAATVTTTRFQRVAVRVNREVLPAA